MFFDFYTVLYGSYSEVTELKTSFPQKRKLKSINLADKSDLFFSGLIGCLSFRES